MATAMTVPMALGCGIEATAAAPIVEMSAAMYVGFAVLFPFLWRGGIGENSLMMGGHVLMPLLMLGAMLLRGARSTSVTEPPREPGAGQPASGASTSGQLAEQRPHVATAADPAHARLEPAQDSLAGAPPTTAVVGDLTADDGSGRHHDVPADGGPGEDDRAVADPGARPDAAPAGGCRTAHRSAGSGSW